MSKYFLLIIPFLSILTACESDMDLYHEQQEWLAFRFYPDQDSITRKTFIYDPEEIKRDTLYIDLHLIGYIADYDRPVAIEQVAMEGEQNAVSGIHYLDFNSEEWKPNLIIQANDSTPKIPIVVLRDTSMLTNDYYLRIKIVGNDYFQPWNDIETYKTILITDQVSCPAAWPEFRFGTWGPVKHRFLIDTFEAITWNDEFFVLLSQDYPYIDYLQGKAQAALDEENEQRAAQNPPLGPLTEKDGTIVKFSPNN